MGNLWEEVRFTDKDAGSHGTSSSAILGREGGSSITGEKSGSYGGRSSVISGEGGHAREEAGRC